MDLFTPIRLGANQLKNRIVMAPMRRSRADTDRSPNFFKAERPDLYKQLTPW